MRIRLVQSKKLDLLSGAGLNLVAQILERHMTPDYYPLSLNALVAAIHGHAGGQMVHELHTHGGEGP